MAQIQLTSSDVLQLTFYTLIGISVLIACSTIVQSIIVWRTTKGAPKNYSEIFDQDAALKMVTVGMIIVGACFLAVLGKIGSDAVAAILSGIVGYVLGGSRKSKSKAAESGH